MKKRTDGEGGLWQRGNIWWCQYYDNGRQIRETTGTAIKSEAIVFLRKRLDSVDKGEVAAVDVKKLRYADLRQGLIDNYITRGNKSLKERADGTVKIEGLFALDEFCGFKEEANDEGKIVVTSPGIPVTSLTTDFAARFVKARKAEGVGNGIINRSLAALRRMLRVAKLAKKIHEVPHIEFLKEPAARKGFLEVAKFEKLIAEIPAHLKPYITFLYYCGGRRGEAELVEWHQVDLKRRLIRFEPEQTKTDEAREIPLTNALVLMLKHMTPKEGRVFDTTNIRKAWMKACAAAGLGTMIPVEGKPYDPKYKGLRVHDLRRSAVRNLRHAGVPETVAMKITGHKTRSVFDRYNIVDTTDVSNAMAAVEANASRLIAEGQKALGAGASR